MLSDCCLSVLSVTFVYCGQRVGSIKMKLGMQVGLGPGHIVLDGDPAPLPKRGRSPQFSAHVYCGQMAGWIKMALCMEVGLGPGHIVLDGDPAPPPPKRGTASQCLLWPMVDHLSYFWALVNNNYNDARPMVTFTAKEHCCHFPCRYSFPIPQRAGDWYQTNMVYHLSTNQAWHRVTSLMLPAPVPLCQTITMYEHCDNACSTINCPVSNTFHCSTRVFFVSEWWVQQILKFCKMVITYVWLYANICNFGRDINSLSNIFL